MKNDISMDNVYSTINFEIEAVDAPGHGDLMRNSVRRKDYKFRASLLLNLILILMIVVLMILMRVKNDTSGVIGGEDGVCVTGQCLQDACNRNGIFDSLSTSCDCFECYGGTYCTEDMSTSEVYCQTVDVSVGDPLLFESYWIQDEPSQAALVEIDPTWGMSYENSDAEASLQDKIRELHLLAGNFDVHPTDSIVVASGSTQLLSAVIYAAAHLIAAAGGDNPPNVYAQVPYYDAYQDIVTYHMSQLLGSFNPAHSPLANETVIEIITSPNNPDGEDRTFQYSRSFRLYDRAYHWPHYTSMQTIALQAGDFDVSVFTLSKMTGHAGTRLGWVVVRDKGLASLIQQYINVAVVSIPHETVWRSRKILSHILESDGAIFAYAKNVLEYRWSIMNDLFHDNMRFTLSPDYSSSRSRFCSFFNKELIPTPAYAWLKCNHVADIDFISSTDSSRIGCDGVLFDGGINGRPGKAYGMSDNSYMRIELLMNDRTFELLQGRLRALLFSINPAE